MGHGIMVKDLLIADLKKILKDLVIEDVIPKLEHPTNDFHGDYSTNVAMQAFGLIKTAQPGVYQRKAPVCAGNVMEMAEKIREGYETLRRPYIEKIEVAKPGFINFWLSKDYLIDNLQQILEKKDQYGGSDKGSGKTMVVDYSGPNIAKSFGIGHLRSTIIGQSIYNLYKFAGWRMIGDNHLGDWGTQFGSLTYQVIDKKLDPEELNIEKLEKLYVDFNKELESNPKLQDQARLWFKKLEEGDSRAREIWQKLVSISLKEFERIYNLLGIKIDYAYGESFYEKMLPDITKECLDKGIVKQDQGALVVKYPNEVLPPAMLQKTDGATTYFIRDLAAIKFRLSEWSPDLVVYEVGNEQSLHFKQLFAVVELLGWAKTDRFVHVRHGLYLSSEGTKFSTRKGKTVHLDEILEEAIARAAKLNEEENKNIAQAVGIGAVKYFDLSHNPASDIIFEWEKMFSLEGNSAPYIQYAFVRTQSVLAKSRGLDPKSRKLEFHPGTFEKEEERLLRALHHFPETVEEAALNFSPNVLCNCLFDLAQKFNLFYQKHPILKAEDRKREFRLGLTQAVGQVIKNGLFLLGINAPEKM